MQEKFTRQAETALELAKKAAQSLKHNYVGTEHILIGLMKEKEGTAGKILEEFGLEEERLEALIDQLIAPPDTLLAERTPPDIVPEPERSWKEQPGRRNPFTKPRQVRSICFWLC